MANVEKISIALPADMATLVRNAVETGDYASSSEVIREALREWKARRAAPRDQMRSVKFGGFGMRVLRADRVRISTSPRSRSVAGNVFRLIASSETRAGQRRCRASIGKDYDLNVQWKAPMASFATTNHLGSRTNS